MLTYILIGIIVVLLLIIGASYWALNSLGKSFEKTTKGWFLNGLGK
jgi:CHASE3 domain sensor protein